MRTVTLFAVILLLVGQVIFLISDASEEETTNKANITEMVTSYEAIVLIPPGEDFTVAFRPQEMYLMPKQEPSLGRECEQALSLVPEWMRLNLTHKFRLLSSDDRTRFADLIINAPEGRFRDEIGFVIAHSTPQTLADENFFPGLITHNAELIYEYDEYLDYVEIVEKSDYTTLAYRQTDNSTVELPREDYYWYVVHPKLGDELPTYVQPNYDYTSDPPFDRNYGVAPPEGKYWRDWFFVYNKTGQPLLKDRLQGKNTTLDAIKAINGWISASMIFTSDNERPVQPVRIYVKGQGRCGEYQDMRAAAARAALIPVIATSNPAEDHVWNEFWDLEWYHWDGTINNPRMYENGWGKTISSVWNSRGDGYTWSVTDRYSDTATITATVLDSNRLPVDGADIDIFTENFYQPEVRSVTYSAVTDSTGKVSMELGDNRNYWGTSDTTDLGSDPVNPLNQVEIALPSEAYDDYDVIFNLPQAAPRLNVIRIQPPNGHQPGINMSVEYDVMAQITRGNARVASGRFDLYQDRGNIDFFIANSNNMNAYRTGLPFSGIEVQERSTSGQVNVMVPPNEIMTTVLSNGFSQWTSKLIRINVTIFGERFLTIDGPESGSEISIGDDVQVNGTLYYTTGGNGIWISFDGGYDWEPVEEAFRGQPGRIIEWQYQWDTSGYRPGQVTILAREARGNGSLMVGTTVALVDDSPPAIRASMDNARVPEGGSISILGTVDDNFGVEEMKYSLDSRRTRNPVELLSDNSEFEMTLSTSNFEIGAHELHLFAYDLYENEGQLTLSFEVLETMNPEVEIISPSPFSIIKYGTPVEIEGRAVDNLGISYLEISMAGDDTGKIIDPEILDAEGYFSIDLDYSTSRIHTGTNHLVLFAHDAAGNSATTSVDIIMDGTRPVILLDSPRIMISSPNDDIEIYGQVQDDHLIETLEISINSGPVQYLRFSRSSGSFSFELDPAFDLDEGDNTAILTVTDSVGWTSVEEVVITVDGQAPVIEFGSLPDHVMKGDPLYISALVDEMYDVEFVTLIITGSGSRDIMDKFDVAEISLTLDSSDLKTGVVDITIRVIDIAGNSGEAVHSIHVLTERSDSDGDDIPDWWEYEHDLDPFFFDSDLDPDLDGYTNLEEFMGDDGEWGEEEDSTDPLDPNSKPAGSGSDRPNTVFWVILGLGGLILIFVILGFLATRRKL